MSEKNIDNITKSDRDLLPTLFDQHLLLGKSFNGHYLIKK